MGRVAIAVTEVERLQAVPTAGSPAEAPAALLPAAVLPEAAAAREQVLVGTRAPEVPCTMQGTSMPMQRTASVPADSALLIAESATRVVPRTCRPELLAATSAAV